MKTEYLAPCDIIAHGFDNAFDRYGKRLDKVQVVRGLADRWNRKPPYIYSWGRPSGNGNGATGEENPIDWFERLMGYFAPICLDVPILMVARVTSQLERMMNTTSQEQFTDAEMRRRYHDLGVLLHVAIESGDDSEKAKAMSAFVRFGSEGLAALNRQNAQSVIVEETVTTRRYQPTAYPAGR